MYMLCAITCTCLVLCLCVRAEENVDTPNESLSTNCEQPTARIYTFWFHNFWMGCILLVFLYSADRNLSTTKKQKEGIGTVSHHSHSLLHPVSNPISMDSFSLKNKFGNASCKCSKSFLWIKQRDTKKIQLIQNCGVTVNSDHCPHPLPGLLWTFFSGPRPPSFEHPLFSAYIQNMLCTFTTHFT